MALGVFIMMHPSIIIATINTVTPMAVTTTFGILFPGPGVLL